jgi:multidrug efflux system outer membrane protein
LLRVSRATLATQEASFELTRKRYELGSASRLDLAQARTTVDTARADVARYEGQIERDTNALQLLVGAPLEGLALPTGFSRQQVVGVPAVPGGLPSDVLLRRPDVRQAEELLRSAKCRYWRGARGVFPFDHPHRKHRHGQRTARRPLQRRVVGMELHPQHQHPHLPARPS